MQRWATSRKIHLRCSEMQDLESGPRIGWQDPTSGELEAASHSSMQARMLGKETLQETEHRSIGQEREGPVGGWSGLLLLLAAAKCQSVLSRTLRHFQTPPDSSGSTFCRLVK